MDALFELMVISATAVVGIFLFKLAMFVLPENMVTLPGKKIAAFL